MVASCSHPYLECRGLVGDMKSVKQVLDALQPELTYPRKSLAILCSYAGYKIRRDKGLPYVERKLSHLETLLPEYAYSFSQVREEFHLGASPNFTPTDLAHSHARLSSMGEKRGMLYQIINSPPTNTGVSRPGPKSRVSDSGDSEEEDPDQLPAYSASVGRNPPTLSTRLDGRRQGGVLRGV